MKQQNILKEIKCAARKTVRSHFGLFLILSLLVVFLGSETTVVREFFRQSGLGGTMEISAHGHSPLTVFEEMLTGGSSNLASGIQDGEAILDGVTGNLGGTGVRALLTALLSALFSGELITHLVSTVAGIIGCSEILVRMLIPPAFVLYAAFWLLVINLIPAAVNRMVLETRCYSSVGMSRLLFFRQVRCWRRAAISMLYLKFRQFLWNLTIIGGLVRHYDYLQMPFIVAENPAAKPKDALHLSMRMMSGHRLEAFCLELSFLGWELLGILSLGILEFLWVKPYRRAVMAEYYAYLRGLVLQEENGMAADGISECVGNSGGHAGDMDGHAGDMDGHAGGTGEMSEYSEDAGDRAAKRGAAWSLLKPSAILTDKALFRVPDADERQATYRDIIEDEQYIAAHAPRLSRVQQFLASWFGIWIGRADDRTAYQDILSRTFRVNEEHRASAGQAYPMRLHPLYRPAAKDGHDTEIIWDRCYTLPAVALLFFAYSMAGWLWEVSLCLVREHTLVNRGFLLGPWLPIYGIGGVLITLLLCRFRKRTVVELLSAALLAGIVEYSIARFMELGPYHARYWDYHGLFCNLDGRICAESLITFAVMGMLVVYVVSPWLDELIDRLPRRVGMLLLAVLLTAFGADVVWSGYHPNGGSGVATDITKGEWPTTLHRPDHLRINGMLVYDMQEAVAAEAAGSDTAQDASK